ncbi:glycine cleavage system protein H [Limnobaculum zhutongyuii]|uniref:Glycine cleavage system protein H n=1 Tax=Limnobaculum zhutongyuii TaxID=2498113 RepID=A0A411WLI8_9GAMM|nr:glycine cleavage system protein H [Limnobaculum zhutongyuii]QBH97028.1 glycine cleavage system protein H [Limnobaculum zhutongyuii]TQS87422.1 glycine cleavage system protein H [Limnobaculum zhutongyuii]
MKTKVMKFTPYFEWVNHYYQAQYRVGITEFAQQTLGEIVYLELPQPGSLVKKDEPCGFVESRKSVVDILAPLSGVIVAENRSLIMNPKQINQSPYEEGWLFTIETDDTQQWNSLLESEPHLENGRGIQND